LIQLTIKNLFLQRFRAIKNLHKTVHFLRVLGQKLRLTGSRQTGFLHDDITTLVLNKSYPLGIKGTVIHLPKDKMIYEFIKLRGKWEFAESEFLANELKRLCFGRNKERVALVDIGANTGLVTLQAMNLSKTQNDCILIEPVRSHAAAIRSNFSNSLFNFQVKEFALSDRNGTTEIYKQKSNRGNSSLIEEVVPISEVIKETVQTCDSQEFFGHEMNFYDSIVLKCDTQGYDAKILSRIPSSVWDKVDSAVIEVWALPIIDASHVKELLDKLSDFSHIGWNSEEITKLPLKDVSDFWLSKTFQSRNLFLRR
jgi:FkbM family methyltransferase